MKKDIYDVEFEKIETTEGYEWMARFPDVPGCVGGGLTKEEALEEAIDNLSFHLESLKLAGYPIPIPEAS